MTDDKKPMNVNANANVNVNVNDVEQVSEFDPNNGPPKMVQDPKSVPTHHFMVVGEILFRPVGASDSELNPAQATLSTLSAIRTNAVVTGQSTILATRQLSLMQQALQMQFWNKIGKETTVEVVDVIILGIMYLGSMSPNDFHAPPPGQVLREMAKPNIDQTGNA